MTSTSVKPVLRRGGLPLLTVSVFMMGVGKWHSAYQLMRAVMEVAVSERARLRMSDQLTVATTWVSLE